MPPGPQCEDSLRVEQHCRDFMDRRTFLGLSAASKPTTTNPATSIQSVAAGDVPAVLRPLVPDASNPWDYSAASHLLRRAMVGPTDAEIRRAVDEGIDRTFERLFTSFEPPLDLIADWAGQDPCNWPPELEGPVYDAWRVVRLGRRERLGRWWLKTIAESPVSLQERMTVFWHQLFTSSLSAAENAEWMYVQNQLFRRMALGNYRELLHAVSKDMAMLRYLDGVENFHQYGVAHINENYARELLELFTMGLADWNGRPNYSQRDVKELARSLSGWYHTPSSVSENHLALNSTFVPHRWDPGLKTVFGRTGAWRMEDAIDLILSERAQHTARFICEKLYRFFVHGSIEQKVVDAMAGMLMGASWEIKPVLAALLRSEHFFMSGSSGALAKTTTDFHLGLIRQFGLRDVPDFDADEPMRPNNELSKRLMALGHMLLNPPNVKGWPGGRAWLGGAVLPMRQRFAVDVINERITYWDGSQTHPLYTYDPVELARRYPRPDDPDALIEDLARHLLGDVLRDAERVVLRNALLGGSPAGSWNVDDRARSVPALRRMLDALVRLPKFQLY